MEGYQPVAFVEKDNNSCFTLQTRLVYYYLYENNALATYYDYLRKKITREELYRKVPNYIHKK